MAQVSYGTITITDTTDIEDIFLIYKGSNSDTTAPSIVWSGSTNDWKTDITQVTGDYIWAITVFKYTGITITSTNYTDYYSSPICLTGEPGTSVTITSITYSTLTTETQPGNDTFTLTAPPTVAEGGWLWSRVLFSNNQSVYSKAKQGQTGQRGTSILKVTTAPSATSGTISGFTYSYRMSLSTVKTQSGKSEVIVGDVVEYNSNHYRVGYVDSTYVYLSAATSIKGADGQTYYTWIKYAPNSNPTDAQINDNPTNMTYIGIYTGTITPAPSTASSYAPWMKYIGTDGSPGSPGVSVTGTRELYYLKTNNTNPSQITNSNQITATDRQNGWTSIVPTYVANGTYYTCIETSLSTGGPVWSAPIENKGLTNANAKALDAYNTSTARDTEINAIQAQAKHYWWDSQGAHVAADTNTTDVNNITQGTPSTYGFNSLMSPGALKLKYQDVDFAQLATNSLTFYRPATSGSTYVQGKKAMDLTADALTFYKPLAYNSSNEPTAAAQLTSNGLKISDGIIQLGTNDSSSTSNGCITLSNTDFTRLISGTSRSSLRLAIGQYFGVKNDGTLYASNAVVSGTIIVGSGSNLSAGLTDYSTTAQTQSYVTGLGYQTASDVSDAVSDGISNASVSDLSDGSSYSTTSQMNTAIGTATNDMATKTYVSNQGYQTASDVSGAINTATSSLATKSDAVYRTQRIYYRKTASGAPSANTTWLTTSGTGYGNWSLKIPQLTNGTTKYPYLYTAIQTQTITQYNGGSGTTCSCSTVLLDDTTTIIDGGAIIAGSVTANEITGNTLSAIYADLGAITAGSISRGNNSINFNQDAATLEFKNGSSWANATRGIQWTGSDLNIKGNITANSLIISSGATVSGVVVPGDISDMATKTQTDWSVIITTTGTPNFTTPSVTLKATVYHRGTIATTGFTRAWYKNGTGNSLGSGETITVTDIDAYYVCIISES